MSKQTPDRSPPLGIVYPFIILLPFLLFQWPYPFLSFTNYGFDYWHHHIQDQMELAFALKSGTFPLFIPGYFYGQTASVLSEGQLFHPLFHLITHLPGYWHGHAADLSMLLHLLGLAGAHLGLFVFLLRLNVGLILSLFLSAITVYNLRLLFLSWFGSPMEAWSGHILLCSAIGCFYLRPTLFKGPLLIIGAAYWLVTCGHPVWTYYGLITAALFTLLLPYYVPVISGENKGITFSPKLKFWCLTAFICVVALLLSGGFVLPYYVEFVATSTGRVDQVYSWAVSQPEPLGEFINNFFLPLRSGHAMFAGTPLFLAAILVPILVLWRIKIPGVIWTITGLVFLIFLYMQGSATPIHALAWKYLPLHHMIRGPARMAFALPLLFMMILAWLLRSQPADGSPTAIERRKPAATTILGLAALILFGLYMLFAPESITADLAPHGKLNLSRLPAWLEPLVFFTCVISFLALIWYGRTARFRQKTVMIFLSFVTVFHLGLLFHFSLPYFSPLAVKKQSSDLRTMAVRKQKSMNIHMDHYYLNPGRGHKIVDAQLRNYFMEPLLGKIYRKYIIADNQPEAYRILNNQRRPDEMVIEADALLQLPNQGISTESNIPDSVSLTYSSYNRMVFTATAGEPAFFVFAWPYTDHWRARVNGRQAPTFRANGAAHAVLIPAGTSTVDFRYWSSAAALGMGSTCLALISLGVWTGFFMIRKPKGYLIAAATISVAAGLFALWHGSLYNGDNLKTDYTWQAPFPDDIPNVAYGKQTIMSSRKKSDRWTPLWYTSRHAVDGDKINAMTSSSHTDLEDSPWWQVDLRSTVTVASILVYLTPPYHFLPFNQRPLSVLRSVDGKNWQTIFLKEDNRQLRIDFKEPVNMRYLKIQASGRCVLSLMEVEVYGNPTAGIH